MCAAVCVDQVGHGNTVHCQADTPYQALLHVGGQPDWYGRHIFRKTWVEHRLPLQVFR